MSVSTEQCLDLFSLAELLPGGDEFGAGQPACTKAGVDPEAFFPPAKEQSAKHARQAEPAKRVCRSCPVRDGCLQYALRTGVSGVWGGTTDDERRRIRLGLDGNESDGSEEVRAA